MRTTFHAELAEINDILVEMAAQVRTAMSSATTALLTADLPLAETVIAGDSRIDAVHDELEERCLQVLALHHPVAIDLRTVVGSLRMVSSLERMGDLARHVAGIARMRYPDHALPDTLAPVFADAGQIADTLSAKVTALLTGHEVALAAEVTAIDDRMDALHRGLFAHLLDDEWAHGIQTALDVLLLGRFYERYADHGVSLARRVVQLVTGELPDAP